MFSFGIEYDRAFSIAFCSARLPDGSGPPSRAATMIARDSFEKSWPRFASAAPFLCLIEAHLLCPDMPSFLHGRQEQLVHARILRQLRVERGDEEATLPKQDRFAVVLREHRDVVPCFPQARRADEDAAKRPRVSGDAKVGLEARNLPAVRVSLDIDVDEAEVVSVEHDHPGTRAEHRARKLTNRLVEPVEPHQPHERRRLPARHDEPVQPFELLRLPDLDDVRAEPTQHRGVLAEVPLYCQNADL